MNRPYRAPASGRSNDVEELIDALNAWKVLVTRSGDIKPPPKLGIPTVLDRFIQQAVIEWVFENSLPKIGEPRYEWRHMP